MSLHRGAALERARDDVRLGEQRSVGGIAVEDDRVEQVARRDAAELVVDVSQLGAALGRGEKRLSGRHAHADCERDLLEVAPVLLTADVVAAERNLHTGRSTAANLTIR